MEQLILLVNQLLHQVWWFLSLNLIYIFVSKFKKIKKKSKELFGPQETPIRRRGDTPLRW